MKKLATLITMVFAFFAINAQPQLDEKANTNTPEKVTKPARVPLKKLEGTSVSARTKSNFAVDFPDITDAQWTRSENFDEATFTRDGQKTTAYYDYEGDLVGSTTPKTFADLPARAQKLINEKYKDYKVDQVIFFDDNDRSDTDMILWATQFDDEDLYFAQLSKGSSKIIVKTDPTGNVSLFKEIK